MKKINAPQKIILLAAFLLPINLMAQDEANDLIKGSPADATKLVNAYFGPAFKGFGVGLNSGWATSARTAGILRFDVRINAALAIVPDSERNFDILALDLQTLKPTNLTNTISPSVVGSKQQGVELVQKNGVHTPFKLPSGTGLINIPSPQLQITLGILENIDISLRYVYIPAFKDFGKINMWGVGTKIEILPLILGKAGKVLPVDVALAGGYTQMKYDNNLDVNNGVYNDQKVIVNVSGYSAEAIVSKKISFFSPFASVGYQKSGYTVDALGSYEINGAVFKDPININNKRTGNLKATAGFQLKFLAFKFYTAYSMSDYNYINIGLGLGTSK